jgi:hypothetical protein
MTEEADRSVDTAEQAPLPGPRGGAAISSPIDLPPLEDGEEEPHPLRWTTIAIATATAFLALFNASALQSWAYELIPGPRTERVVRAASGWFELTGRARLNLPVETMGGWWNALREAPFPSGAAQPPASEDDLAPPRLDAREGEPRPDPSPAQ